MKRYRLNTRAQMHGTVREPGYVFTLAEGEVGPHRTVVASNHGAQITDHMNQPAIMQDIPLYDEIDESLDKEREDMRLRHEGEIAEIDRNAQLDELRRKQAEESAVLHAKEAEAAVVLRHQREADALKARQESETAGFKVRQETLDKPKVIIPGETDEQALSMRHKAEAEALEKKHAAEDEAAKARAEAAAAAKNRADAPEAKPAPEGEKSTSWFGESKPAAPADPKAPTPKADALAKFDS